MIENLMEIWYNIDNIEEINNFTFKSYLILLTFSFIWILVLSHFYEYIVCLFLNSFLKYFLLNNEKGLNVKFAAFNLNIFNFSLTIRQVKLSFEKSLCFSIDELTLKFNNKNNSISYKIMSQSMSAKDYMFIIELKDTTIFLIEKSINLNNKSFNNLFEIFKRSIIVIHNLNIFSINQKYNLVLSMSVSKALIVHNSLKNEQKLKDLEMLENCDDIFEVKSFLLNVYDLTFNFKKFHDSKKLKFSCNFQPNLLYKICQFLTIKQSKIEIYYGDLPNYEVINSSHINVIKPNLLIDIDSVSNIKFEFDLWNDLVPDIFNYLFSYKMQFQLTTVLRCKMKNFEFTITHLNDKIISLKFDSAQNLEICHIFNESILGSTMVFKLNYTSFSLNSLFNRMSQMDNGKLSINWNEDFVQLYLKTQTKINLNNFVQNSNLFYLVILKLRSILNDRLNLISFQFISYFDLVEFLVFNSVKCRVEKINLKFEINEDWKVLVNFYNLNLSILHENLLLSKNIKEFSVFCERVTVEALGDYLDDKFQMVFAPIIFGEKFLNEKLAQKLNTVNSDNSENGESLISSHLKNSNDNEKTDLSFNALYVTVVQLRIQNFYNNKQLYSNQVELIVGDIFGSIEFEHFLSLANLISLLGDFFMNEFQTKSIITDKMFDNIKHYQCYHSKRLITSLLHVNLINFNSSKVLPIVKTILFNVNMSPVNYGSCDCHVFENKSGYILLISDLEFKILCSIEGDSKNSTNFIESGRFCLNYLISNKVNENKGNDFLNEIRSYDEESKRLWFLWELENNGCACTGQTEFFSHLPAQLYNYKRLAFKPCIYWLNTDSDFNSTIQGFGQSILVDDEVTFFSYKFFFIESINENQPFELKNFIVLSHLENDNSLDGRKKFEPNEICFYEKNDLHRFINEKIDLKHFKSETEIENLTSNFNSANMSPPYFASEFSIYIRYLPLIKNLTKLKNQINFKIFEQNLEFDLKNDENLIIKSGLPKFSKSTEFLKEFKVFNPKLRRVKVEANSEFTLDPEISSRKSLDATSSILTVANLSFVNNNLPSDANSSLKNGLSSISLYTKQKTKAKPFGRVISVHNKDDLSKDSKNFDTNTNNNNNLTEVTDSTRKSSIKLDSNFYLTILPCFKFNLKQIDAGIKLNKENMSIKNRKKISIQQVFIQSVVYESDEKTWSNLFHRNNTNNIVSKRLKSKSQFSILKSILYISPIGFQCRDCFKPLLELKRNLISNNFEIDLILNEIDLNFVLTEESFFKNQTVRFQFNNFNILKTKTEFLFNLNEFKFFKSIELLNKIDNLTLVNLIEKFMIIDLLNSIRKIANFKFLLKNILIISENDFDIKIPGFEINQCKSSDEQFNDLDIAMNNCAIQQTIPSCLAIEFYNIFKKLFYSYHMNQLEETNSIKNRFKLTILNLDIALRVNDLNENFILKISCESFQLKSSNKFKYLNFFYEFNGEVNIDLIRLKERLVLIQTKLIIDKKLLDASLIAEIEIDSSLNLPRSEQKSVFSCNFIFPVVIKSQLKQLLNGKNGFEWSLPGVLAYFTCNKEIFQVFEINKPRFIFEENILELEILKFRILRSHLDIELKSILKELINQIFIKNHQNTSNQNLSLRLKIEETIISYFPETVQNKNWLFLKINEFEIDFEMKYNHFFHEELIDVKFSCFKKGKIQDISIIENSKENFFKFFFKTILNNESLNQNDRIKANSSIVLLLTSTSSLFSKFDFNKWLDYVSLESSEPNSYKIELVSALPNTFFKLHFQTQINNDLNSMIKKWSFSMPDNIDDQNEFNRNSFVINPNVFETVVNQIINKNFHLLQILHKIDLKNWTQFYPDHKELDLVSHITDTQKKVYTTKEFSYLNRDKLAAVIHNRIILNIVYLLKLLKKI